MISDPTNFPPAITSNGGKSLSATRHESRGSELVSPAEFSFKIPAEHAEFFAKRVAHKEQKRVRRLLVALEEIYRSPKTNPAIRRFATELNMNFNTLRRQYYAFTLGCEKASQIYAPGDWRSVLNWTKVRTEKARLPFAFLEFWRTLGEQNQRCWKPAWDELMQIIRTRQGFPHGTTPAKFYKNLPGFPGGPSGTDWPKIDPVLGHPAGMSYENLMRHISDPFDTSLARHGRAKASALRVPVLKTRVGLHIGQYVEFDDHDFNQKPMFQKKPMRPSGFGAVDVLTSCMPLAAFKPNLWSFEEQKRLTLTEREFMWFVIAYLTTVGVRTDSIGTTLIVERAKAAIREPFRSRLLAMVPNLKIYDGGGKPREAGQPGPLAGFARPAFDGQWRGKAKGNFRTKALIESFWNPVDNQTAMLVGQMGKDRDHAPAQLHGAESYTASLVRQIEAKNLSPEAAAMIEFPFLTFHQWSQFAHEAIMRINRATDHNCEGWEKNNFVKVVWREDETSDEWRPVSDLKFLSPARREILDAKIAHGQKLTRPIRLSRWDAFQSLRHELKPVPLYHIPELVGRENALDAGEPLAVGRSLAGLFTFECAEIDPDPIEFYARDERGYLKTGDRYVCFVNPCAPTHLIACDEQLRVKAICPRYERARLDNEPALKALMGEQGAFEAAARVRLNLRHDDAAKQIRALKARNAEGLAGDAGTPPRAIGPDAVSDCTTELLEREAALENETPNDWV